MVYPKGKNNSPAKPPLSISPRERVVITGVSPMIAGGRYPVKRVRGERVRVEADIFADSHDVLTAILLVRRLSGKQWHALPMRAIASSVTVLSMENSSYSRTEALTMYSGCRPKP